jgi:hypothetical protein
MTKTAVGHQDEALARERLRAQAAFALSRGRVCANLRAFASNCSPEPRPQDHRVWSGTIGHPTCTALMPPGKRVHPHRRA